MLVCKFLVFEQYKYAHKSCDSVVNCPAATTHSVNKTLAIEVKVLMLQSVNFMCEPDISWSFCVIRIL